MAELCVKIRAQPEANKTQTNYTKTDKGTKGENERPGANARRSFQADMSTAGLKVTRRKAGKGAATKTSTKADNNGDRTGKGAKTKEQTQSWQRPGQSQTIDPAKNRQRADKERTTSGQREDKEKTRSGHMADTEGKMGDTPLGGATKADTRWIHGG